MPSSSPLAAAQRAQDLAASLDTLWALSAAAYAVLLTVGAAVAHTGKTGGRNVSTGLAQGFIVLSVGTVAWWLCGYGVAFGASGAALGTEGAAYAVDSTSDSADRFFGSLPLLYASLGVFSSGVVGRMTLPAFVVVVAVHSAFVVPVVVHAVWGDHGWLAAWSPSCTVGRGVLDSGGFAAVHVLGGALAVGSGFVLGPRRLRGGVPLFSEAGRDMTVAHDKFAHGAGTLLLWCGYIALAGSGVGTAGRARRGEGESLVGGAAHAMAAEALGGSAALAVSTWLSRERLGYLRHADVFDGGVAGLVAASGGFFVPLAYAPLLGAGGAAVHVLCLRLKEVLGLDDGLDAASVHLGPGLWGLLASSLAASSDLVAAGGAAAADDSGVRLCVHALFGVCVVGWGLLAAVAVLEGVDRVLPVCPHGEDEREGLDATVCGGPYCGIIGDLAHRAILWPNPGTAAAAMAAAEAAAAAEDGVEGPTEAVRRAESLRSAAPLPPRARTLLRLRPSPGLCVRTALFCATLGAATALGATSGSGGGGRSREAWALLTSGGGGEADAANRTEGWTVSDARVRQLEGDVHTMWLLVCAMGVFLMQLGFCFLEAGSVRSGNVITIVFKNFADCAFGALGWWLVGYSFAFASGSPFVGGGTAEFFAFSPGPRDSGYRDLGRFFLSFTYMTTAATIVSGGIAERMSLSAYAMISAAIATVGYPLGVHWLWSDHGWLSPFSSDRIAGNGTLDFAGSIVIHLFGGACALGFAWLLGPRQLAGSVDVFSPEGQVLVAPHNKFQQACGTLLLWFSWLAFNGGSVGSIADGGASVAAGAMICTVLAGSAATVVGAVFFRWHEGYFHIGHTCNTALTGLVSITAGCGYVSPGSSLAIGALATPVYYGVFRARTRLRIDDVVDAGAVHFGGGLWGGVAVGLFADADRIAAGTGLARAGVDTSGLFMGGGATQLGLQLLAILCVVAWAALFVPVVYLLASRLVDVRVTLEAELAGIDITEHRAHSYDYIERLERERFEAEESQRLLQGVAECMVRFDLDTADALLQTHSARRGGADGTAGRAAGSDALREALVGLVGNLRSYRPYLPESLFATDPDAELLGEVLGPSSVLPPGGDGQAALCCVCVEGCRALDEAHPLAMREARAVYGVLLREAVGALQGYVVGAQRDRVVVAFRSFRPAVSFALQLQQRAHDAEWPAALRDHPCFGAGGGGGGGGGSCSGRDSWVKCEGDNSIARGSAWNGLRLKIGVASGPVDTDLSRVTGRFDYKGSAVVQAEALCTKAVGGTVAVMEMTNEEAMHEFNCVSVLSLPLEKLRGVRGTHTVLLLVPQALEGRAQAVEAAVYLRDNGSGSDTSPYNPLVAPASGSMSVAAGVSGIVSPLALPPSELKESVATIATVRMGELSPGGASSAAAAASETLNSVLNNILRCLQRTEGSVVSVCGTQVVLGWNTARRCLSHADQGVRFAAQLHSGFESLGLRLQRGCHPRTGIATGWCMHGSIGAHGQRFVNVFGPCVALSAHLASAAEALEAFVLVASMPGHPVAEENPLLAGAVRPVDTWSLPNVIKGTAGAEGEEATEVAREAVDVYEICADRVYEAVVREESYSSVVVDIESKDHTWEWGTGYAKAFRQKRWQDIAKVDCHIMKTVAMMLREGKTLRSIAETRIM